MSSSSEDLSYIACKIVPICADQILVIIPMIMYSYVHKGLALFFSK